jgi:uncharacterized protein YdaU (DUF1376 family)
MVAYYKHNIADWINGTGGLSHTEYRVYHVICQLIYLNEGPIANNERGIAGLCSMHVNAYRSALKNLVEAGKIQHDTGSTTNGHRSYNQGTLSQHRADTELTLIGDRRETAGRGGRHKAANALKNKEAALPEQNDTSTIKTRLDKTRLDKNTPLPPKGGKSARRSASSSPDFDRFWEAFPKKAAKGAAELRFAEVVKRGVGCEVLIAAAKRYAASRRGEDPKFTAHAATWLRAKRWLDEDEPKAKKPHDDDRGPMNPWGGYDPVIN